MLSKFEYDGQLNPNFRAGPFALPITALRAARFSGEAPAPRFVLVAAAGDAQVRRWERGKGVRKEAGLGRAVRQVASTPVVALCPHCVPGEQAEEEALRASGLPHAVVRAPAGGVDDGAGRAAELQLVGGSGAAAQVRVVQTGAAFVARPARESLAHTVWLLGRACRALCQARTWRS